MVVRALARLLALFVLTLGLTFGTSSAASAYASPPSPITIGTAVKAAPVRMITSVTPAGLAINTAVMGGMLLYETKDSWMPVVKGLFNGDWSVGEDTQAPTYSCQGSLSYQVTEDKRGLTGIIAKNGCGSNTNGHYVDLQNVVCYFPGPNTVGGGSSYLQVTMVTGAAGSAAWTISNVCGSGGQILQGKIRWEMRNSVGGRSYGQWMRFNVAAPEDSTTQTTTITCRQPDGTTVTISDTLTGFGDRIAVPSCADRVPNSIPWSGSVKAGPIGGVQKDVWTFTTPQSVFDEYADCFGPTGLQCEIRVFVSGEACTRGDIACVNWKQYALDYPSRVSCRFGSHVVALTQCEPLRHAYKTQTKTVTEVDPSTGEPVTDPETSAPPETGTGTPTTGPNPTGPGTTPTETTDPDSQGCFGEMWGWNPVDWVLVPVKCALKWAFVPSRSVVEAKVTSMRDAWNGTAPGKWAASFTGFTLDGSETVNCQGPAFNVQNGYFGWDETVRPFEACSGVMATAAGLCRLFLTVVTVVFGGLACVRALGSGLGWNPGIGGGGSA